MARSDKASERPDLANYWSALTGKRAAEGSAFDPTTPIALRFDPWSAAGHATATGEHDDSDD